MPTEKPVAGRDYPRSYAQLRAWFDEDWKCLDYLDWMRWPEGFVCPHCASPGWRLADTRWKCGGCGRKVSATASTIFDRTRTPLTIWFATGWRMVGDKVGVSATQIQREMELGSYQTAWAMLHRYRSVTVRPGRDRLRGDVEVDESFLGGPEPGIRGRGALGKVLLAGAVERRGEGMGRVRLGIIPNANAETLGAFLADNVEPGSLVITDGWSALPAGHPRALPAQRHLGGRLGPAGPRGVARRAPGVLPGQALDDGHPARIDQPRTPPGLPRRVGLPLQPTPLTQPRPAVPPAAPGGRRQPTAAVPGPAQGRPDPPGLDIGRPELPWRS